MGNRFGGARAVGSAAVELIHARGGHAIALVKDEAESERLDRTKLNAVAHSNRNDLQHVFQEATGGGSANVALNGIGGSALPAFLKSLASGGRMTVYSVAFGGRQAALDLFALYRERHQLRWRLVSYKSPAHRISACPFLARLSLTRDSGRIILTMSAGLFIPKLTIDQFYETAGRARSTRRARTPLLIIGCRSAARSTIVRLIFESSIGKETR